MTLQNNMITKLDLDKKVIGFLRWQMSILAAHASKDGKRHPYLSKTGN